MGPRSKLLSQKNGQKTRNTIPLSKSLLVLFQPGQVGASGEIKPSGQAAGGKRGPAGGEGSAADRAAAAADRAATTAG